MIIKCWTDVRKKFPIAKISKWRRALERSTQLNPRKEKLLSEQDTFMRKIKYGGKYDQGLYADLQQCGLDLFIHDREEKIKFHKLDVKTLVDQLENLKEWMVGEEEVFEPHYNIIKDIFEKEDTTADESLEGLDKEYEAKSEEIRQWGSPDHE